jgi:drug/metabolite transporter (DMT)-like permease
MTGRFAEGVALAVVAVLIWGAQFPIAKSAFATVDPYHVTAIRYAAATLLLVPIVAWLEGATALRYYGRLRPASLLGVIGMTGSPLLVFAGLSFTRPEHAAIIVSLQPSMTAVADWLIRGRRPARFTIGCIAIAFLGVVLVVTKGNPTMSMTGTELAGDLLVLLGAMCWVVYTMNTESFRGWSALKFTILTLIPGSIGLVVATALAVPLGLAHVPTWNETVSVGAELAFLALGGVLLSMICWNAGNKRIGALNSVLLLNLIPVVTFAIRFAQGQRFEPIELVGACMVLGALAANNLYLRRVHARRLTP